MVRTILLILACWAFSVPLLCTSGILVHPCDCDSPSGCDHETECSDDPCNATAVVQNGLSLRTFGFSELIASRLGDAPSFFIEKMCCKAPRQSPESPGVDNRPYAEGDLPLLI